jgi:polyhydroxybutyrate depolymerase
VYQPELLDGGGPLPLVINLHGYSESAALEAYRSNMNAFAEKEYFIVCYPEGTGLRKSWTRNTPFDIPRNTIRNTRSNEPQDTSKIKDKGKAVDNVSFLDALIDTLISNYHIDTTRIYLVGFSNGGQMAMFAGAALPERIAGIAVAGAGFSQEQLESLNPERPVRLIAFHSRNDPASRYDGCIYKGISYPSIYKIISTWAQKCGCNPSPDTTVFDGDVLKIRWHNDSSEIEVVLWSTPEGGHTWPGGQGIPFPGGSKPCHKINSNKLMWEFFCAPEEKNFSKK